MKKVKNKIYLIFVVTHLLWIISLCSFVYLYVKYDGMSVIENILLPAGLLVAVLLAISFFVVIRQVNSLVKPLTRMISITKKIKDGDLRARYGIKSADEYEEVTNALDSILEKQVGKIEQAEAENEKINDSIISILHTVVMFAQSKDLSARVKVQKDVTGPLADSLNLMAGEISKVLEKITLISGEVAETSNLVKIQSDNVLLLANSEQKEVDQTAESLLSSIESILNITDLAKESDVVAKEAMQTTTVAMDAVSDTVQGTDAVRRSIREAEKKIKRLGERSQEIGNVVNLIGNISERTHILALNASMHAVAAGEAGKGFAVVADEVQRLAQNAQESTAQISSLVNNIQLETSDTVNTMNALINQVVQGSDLAEKAREQMRETYDNTSNLVNMVELISENATVQANISKQLQNRSNAIRESVKKTGTHLTEQSQHTNELLDQAMALVGSIGEFKLSSDRPDSSA